uniref:Phosphoadenosine phosphosulfate n=1 Tax=viral metagenome TaxID=1070528 RepID=A0A6M3XJT0_9ZZZZ
MLYIVCFSGGHSSALAAIETVRRYGKSNVILLNHDISPEVEHKDIKRFKDDVSNYLDIGITYANMEGWETKTPLRICKEISAFKVDNGTALCTNRLKTEPFKKWLKENIPADIENVRKDVKIIYGFDSNEPDRIQRRVGVMASIGYLTEYPLATMERTIGKVEDIGIPRPVTYKLYRHANCTGCLKAGKQQWYVVYCTRPDIWEEAKETEKAIGYSILKDVYLEDLENEFYEMKYKKFICPDEKTPPTTFWANVNKVMPGQVNMLPCECAI